MLLSYLRTICLYLVLILVVRLMGKRQIGEMEPAEFVVTMLIANLAAIPMQDSGIPLLSGLVPILTVLGVQLILAVASSYRDKPIPSGLAAIGEVGLTGEIRAVNYLPQRLAELSRLGFDQVMIPHQGSAKLIPPEGMQLIRVKNIRQAIDEILG